MNLVQLPDYTADEFHEEQQIFIDAGLTLLQATDALRNLWTLKNNRDRDLWQQRQLAAAAAEEAAREQVNQLHAKQEDEEAQLLKEEHKIKFAPIPDCLVASDLLILPSLVAIWKIKNHCFCELWYFTNAGLDEAERTTAYLIHDNSLIIVPAADGSHSFVPSAFAWDKSVVVKDEDLSFEQFSQAILRMVDAMNDCGWQWPHVDMHMKFWSNIKGHHWRNSRIESKQCALLIYQGNWWWKWHATISGLQAFNLKIIL